MANGHDKSGSGQKSTVSPSAHGDGSGSEGPQSALDVLSHIIPIGDLAKGIADAFVEIADWIYEHLKSNWEPAGEINARPCEIRKIGSLVEGQTGRVGLSNNTVQNDQGDQVDRPTSVWSTTPPDPSSTNVPQTWPTPVTGGNATGAGGTFTGPCDVWIHVSEKPPNGVPQGRDFEKPAHAVLLAHPPIESLKK